MLNKDMTINHVKAVGLRDKDSKRKKKNLVHKDSRHLTANPRG